MSYESILVEMRGRVSPATLSRPKAFNAPNDVLMDGLSAALFTLDADANIGAITITGGEKAFAVGADIGAMVDYDLATIYKNKYTTRNWGTIRRTRRPVIAAAAGYVLGDDCELAMMCDIILAVDTTKFDQPEVKLGTMPGASGTQRLPRAVSKARAMDLCLTARMMGAEEVKRAGLVSCVIPADKLLDEAIQTAETIAGFSLPTVMMIKESINAAYETSLSEGVHLERRLFHSMFATEDQREGMRAFIEKCAPAFKHQQGRHNG